MLKEQQAQHISKILNAKIETPRWLVENLIPMPGLTILVGDSGSYKTFLGYAIAIKISQGDILFNQFKTMQGNVLIIDEENDDYTFQERFKLLKANDTLPIFHRLGHGFKADVKNDIEMILNDVREHDIKLVIIDSLVRIHGKDENLAHQMAPVFEQLKKITRAGVAVLLIHHNNKQDTKIRYRMRGSSEILAVSDCSLAVQDQGGRIKITQIKLRTAKALDPFNLLIDATDNHVSFLYDGSEQPKKTKVGEAEEAIINLLRKEEAGLSRKMIVEKLNGENIGLNSINDALQKLKDSEQVDWERDGKEDVYYYDDDDCIMPKF